MAIADVKMELQVKYDFASAELSKALNALDNLLSQISVLNMDAASIFSVHSLHFNGGLSKLLSGNSFAVNARLTFLGKQGQIGFTFNPANPTTSLKQIVTSLMAGDIQLSNSDKTPPTILEVTAFAQQAVFNAEDDLLAAKNHRDSQIALLQEGYADLIFYAELVLNNAMFQLGKLEDAIEQAPAILKAGLELGLSAAEKLVANKQQALLQIKNELSGKIQLVQDEYNLANKQLMDCTDKGENDRCSCR